MFDDKTLQVWKYLKNYFKTSNKPINPLNVNIDGLTLLDVSFAVTELNNNGLIHYVS